MLVTEMVRSNNKKGVIAVKITSLVDKRLEKNYFEGALSISVAVMAA